MAFKFGSLDADLAITGALRNVKQVLQQVVLFPLEKVSAVGVDIFSDGSVCVEAADVYFTYLHFHMPDWLRQMMDPA